MRKPGNSSTVGPRGSEQAALSCSRSGLRATQTTRCSATEGGVDKCGRETSAAEAACKKRGFTGAEIGGWGGPAGGRRSTATSCGPTDPPTSAREGGRAGGSGRGVGGGRGWGGGAAGGGRR